MTCKDCIKYQSGRCAKSDDDNEVCSKFVGKEKSMDGLAVCPFCGKSVAEFATMKELEDCKHFEDDVCPACEIDECTGMRIVCNVLKGGCGASTGFAWSKERAIELWNRRANNG